MGNNDRLRIYYLDKVTLVALVTRGNETVYFAFDLVLLIILFWGGQRKSYYFGGFVMEGQGGGKLVGAVYLVWFIPFR